MDMGSVEVVMGAMSLRGVCLHVCTGYTQCNSWGLLGLLGLALGLLVLPLPGPGSLSDLVALLLLVLVLWGRHNLEALEALQDPLHIRWWGGGLNQLLQLQGQISI